MKHDVTLGANLCESTQPFTNGVLAAASTWDVSTPLAIPRDQLLKISGLTRSKSYEIENPKHPHFDKDFPEGFRLFDSPNAKKVYWYSEVIEWLRKREAISNAKANKHGKGGDV